MRDVKFSRYDPADYLDSEESIAAFLDGLESDGDDGAAQLARALGVVARARMLTQLARDAHMRRRELVDTFTAVYPPSSETLTKIARALGLNDLDFSHVKSDPPWWVRNVIPLPGYRLAVQFQDFSEANVEACAKASIAPLIAPGRERHHRSWKERFAAAPPAPDDPTPLQAMAHRLATPQGRQAYALRKQTPEPVFGIIKSVMGFRQFHLRGLEKVKGEWNLVTLAWNMKRMFALSQA